MRRALLAAPRPTRPLEFVHDAAANDRLWGVRRGLIPLVGGQRSVGSSFLLEDVAVEVARLAPLTRDLKALFAEMGCAGRAGGGES
jgi:D-lactate dehydrogenase